MILLHVHLKTSSKKTQDKLDSTDWNHSLQDIETFGMF